MRMPLGGSRAAEEALAGQGTVQSFQCSQAAEGACVINELRGNEKVISLFDPVRGRRGEITRVPLATGDAAMAPDGKRLAFAVGQPLKRIRILTIEGRAEQEIVVEGASRLVGLDWSADGEGFFCGDISATNSSILRVERDGKSRVLWTQHGRHDIWAIPSADGRYLAIDGATESANVWIAESDKL